MPQGVIGHGMPAGQHYSLGNNQVRFGSPNFREITDGEYTLGEALHKAEWDKLLPPPEEFAKVLKEHLFNNANFWISTLQNAINGVASTLFLAAVVGLTARFFRFATNSVLSANEDNFETGRVATDILGYFLAPFIITICSATLNQLVITLARMASCVLYDLILTEYKRSRAQLILTHNITMVLFSITEIIYELETVPRASLDLAVIDEKLKNLLEKIGINYNLCLEPRHTSISTMNTPNIIEKLKQLLLGETFSFVFQRILYRIRNDALKHLRDKSYSYETIDAYEDKITKDAFTHRVLMSLIGRISSKKQKPVPSTLLKTLPLLEESTETTISLLLTKIWNKPGSSYTHPYDVDKEVLAIRLNILMGQSFPGYVIPETVPQAPPPSLLPPPPPPAALLLLAPLLPHPPVFSEGWQPTPLVFIPPPQSPPMDPERGHLQVITDPPLPRGAVVSPWRPVRRSRLTSAELPPRVIPMPAPVAPAATPVLTPGWQYAVPPGSEGEWVRHCREPQPASYFPAPARPSV